MRLLILFRWWCLIALAFLALGLGTLFYIAIKKDVLRNPGKLEKTAASTSRKSYSLAKTQMLFWFPQMMRFDCGIYLNSGGGPVINRPTVSITI